MSDLYLQNDARVRAAAQNLAQNLVAPYGKALDPQMAENLFLHREGGCTMQYNSTFTASKSTSNTGATALTVADADPATVTPSNYNLTLAPGSSSGIKVTWNGVVLDNQAVGTTVTVDGGSAGSLTLTLPGAAPGGAVTDVVTIAAGVTVYTATVYDDATKQTVLHQEANAATDHEALFGCLEAIDPNTTYSLKS